MKKYFLLLLLGLAGCSSTWTVDLSNVNSVNNPVVQPTIQYPDWTVVDQGIDFKQVVVADELFDLVRIDPNQAQLSIVVDEIEPKTVSDWQTTLGATVVINGSYFDEQYELVTRTVTADQSFGPLLSGQTGIFTSDNGQWLITDDQTLLSDPGVQSYPLLLLDGVVQQVSTSLDTAQRSVIATDSDGNVYFIICEYGVLTLSELATALDQLTDPTLVSALNLDGGTSTGLTIQSDTLQYVDDSLVVPSVFVL